MSENAENGSGPRPSRAEIEPAALRVIARHGAQVLRTARRYSLCPEDGEDAYQRGLEILLTKAPTTHESELVPWLKTVVKHEALAIRRQRQRAAPADDEELQRVAAEAPGHPAAATLEHAERYERLRLGAEALKRLKPQEVRCMLLLAEGYSYKQICGLDLYEGQPLPHRGPPGLPGPGRRHRSRGGVRALRASAVRAGRR